MEIATILTTSLCGYIVWYLQRHHCIKDDTKHIALIFLRGQLYDRYERLMASGEIDATELNETEEIYELYHKYGGNGTGTKMINDIRGLKLTTED